ncbi:hypothetical protein DIPPA_05375 [Diplonema papillatum]|nr:hypothetical protein DIPPA_05375 [Diplonema papillatum]
MLRDNSVAARAAALLPLLHYACCSIPGSLLYALSDGIHEMQLGDTADSRLVASDAIAYSSAAPYPPAVGGLCADVDAGVAFYTTNPATQSNRISVAFLNTAEARSDVLLEDPDRLFFGCAVDGAAKTAFFHARDASTGAIRVYEMGYAAPFSAAGGLTWKEHQGPANGLEFTGGSIVLEATGVVSVAVRDGAQGQVLYRLDAGKGVSSLVAVPLADAAESVGNLAPLGDGTFVAVAVDNSTAPRASLRVLDVRSDPPLLTEICQPPCPSVAAPSIPGAPGLSAQIVAGVPPASAGGTPQLLFAGPSFPSFNVFSSLAATPVSSTLVARFPAGSSGALALLHLPEYTRPTPPPVSACAELEFAKCKAMLPECGWYARGSVCVETDCGTVRDGAECWQYSHCRWADGVCAASAACSLYATEQTCGAVAACLWDASVLGCRSAPDESDGAEAGASDSLLLGALIFAGCFVLCAACLCILAWRVRFSAGRMRTRAAENDLLGAITDDPLEAPTLSATCASRQANPDLSALRSDIDLMSDHIDEPVSVPYHVLYPRDSLSSDEVDDVIADLGLDSFGSSDHKLRLTPKPPVALQPLRSPEAAPGLPEIVTSPVRSHSRQHMLAAQIERAQHNLGSLGRKAAPMRIISGRKSSASVAPQFPQVAYDPAFMVESQAPTPTPRPRNAGDERGAGGGLNAKASSSNLRANASSASTLALEVPAAKANPLNKPRAGSTRTRPASRNHQPSSLKRTLSVGFPS